MRSQTAVLQFHTKQPGEYLDGRRRIKGKKHILAGRAEPQKQTVSAVRTWDFHSRLINGWLSTHYVSPFGHVNRVCIIDCSSQVRGRSSENSKSPWLTQFAAARPHFFALSHLIRRRMQLFELAAYILLIAAFFHQQLLQSRRRALYSAEIGIKWPCKKFSVYTNAVWLCSKRACQLIRREIGY